MRTDLHLVLPGTCREAFAFYEKTFASKIIMTLTFGEAPTGSPVPEDAKDLIMHTSMNLGPMLLMGCDAPPGRESPLGGFQISIESPDESEIKRLFATLSEGGAIQMPLTPTFWSPLFAMFNDRFGVGWMLSMPAAESPE